MDYANYKTREITLLRKGCESYIYAESLFFLPWVIGLLTLGMVISTILAWVQCYWGWLRRLHYTVTTLAALAALAFVWFMVYWKLLSIA